ncbi:hypothetical protein QTP70_026406, partial [Hemibagrus guttatus]
MCINYQTLNSKTIPDQYTTPHIDDALDCLAGSRWFSILDLRSGYYQIGMVEEDQEKTAFICPLAFYQFKRMPQGVMGAPATFQCLLEKAIGDMNLLQVLVYLDDLIVFGATLEEHKERLLKVLDCLEEVGLKVSLDKCQFCQPKVRYVGHIVSAEGIATDPTKVEAVTKWPQPTDLKSLRSFLGFSGYYHRFIAKYAFVVKPLTDLHKGYPPVRKGKKCAGKDQCYFKESEPFGSRWTDACTKAFRDIIGRLTSAPVLSFADPNKPYVLHTDASFKGLGAVLNQVYTEGLRPVAFASRGLNTAEQQYHIHQLEFLALKWAVVDKFHDYLYGNCTEPDLEPWRNLSQSDVKAICSCVQVSEESDSDVRVADKLGVPVEGIPKLYTFPTHLNLGQLEQLTREDLQKAQQEDCILRVVQEALST